MCDRAGALVLRLYEQQQRVKEVFLWMHFSDHIIGLKLMILIVIDPCADLFLE